MGGAAGEGRVHREPGPDHPIEVSHTDGFATAVSPSGHLLAASRSAILLEEAGYEPVTYFPREHADPSVLVPTATKSWCPFKGEASYDEVLGEADKAWTYYDPFPAVADIAGHVAFYPGTATIGTERLPAPPPEAVELLQYWFETLDPRQWFEADAGTDADLRERFGSLLERAETGGLQNWRRDPDGALAEILVIDQLPRSLHRGSAKAFSFDEQAREAADHLVARGFDLALQPRRRAFGYLPFMHAEDIRVQNRSVRLYQERLPGEPAVPYALEHRAEIHRFGRFLGRDAALGR